MFSTGSRLAIQQLAGHSIEHGSNPPKPVLAPSNGNHGICCLKNKHTCMMLVCACRRWVGQHGDQARELQAVQDARQQAEDRVEALTTQLEQEQQQVQQQKDRCGSRP